MGELGYEIHVEAGEKAVDIYDALMASGRVALAGFEAFNSMGLEKGHKLWHADLHTTDLPVEAGLLFACKGLVNFEGKDHLALQPKKRLVTFTVDPEVALNGNEPIYRNGEAVGYLRRGGFGYTINKGIGTGYVILKAKPTDQPVSEFVQQGCYEVDVMGTRHKAEPSLWPLFDAKRAKMMLEE